MNCEICKKDLISLKSLSQHIRFHNVSSKEYYDKYLKKENEEICVTCGEKTKFKNLSKGYQKFCNLKCSNNNNDIKLIISEKRKDRWNNIETEKLKELKEKISNTIKEYWNNYNSSYHKPEYKNKLKISQKNRRKIDRESLISRINKETDFSIIGSYTTAGKSCFFQCKKCNKIFETIWNYLQQGKKCPSCGQISISKSEEELREFLKNLGLTIIENSKKIIPPKELDIFIPDLKIAIEYNGLYWHSEQNIKEPNYHLIKTNECKKQGIQLIQIFEDEWLFKKDIVKSRLKQILKMHNQKIYARDCIIKEIDSKIKNIFLEENHIQGQDISVVKLGAFYNNTLISVMTFSHGNIAKGSKKIDDIWELNRFCGKKDYHILGIGSKLLAYFKRNWKWSKIFSYADKRWSNGNLYYKLGFKLIEETKPNYWYLSNYHRIHRFNMRKRNNEPKEIPEWVLREKEGYYRIWDCGNLKFEIIAT